MFGTLLGDNVNCVKDGASDGISDGSVLDDFDGRDEYELGENVSSNVFTKLGLFDLEGLLTFSIDGEMVVVSDGEGVVFTTPININKSVNLQSIAYIVKYICADCRVKTIYFS